MKKKGFVACGCLVFAILVVLAIVIPAIVNHYPSPLPEDQQKALVAELTLPAGTKLHDGIGIVAVVDVSGSMADSVRDTEGGFTKKIELARRVTRKTLEAIQAYASANPGKNVQLGLIRFGSHAKEVLPLGPPDPAQFAQAIDKLTIEGSTAIGEAMVAAKKQLNRAALTKQYMIVITDGQNTNGRAPEDVVKALKSLPEDQRATVYLVAFDIGAKVFQPLVQQGVPVSEARDAKGLQAALDYILYQKILVEQE